uniref:Ornithine cyclodeaminase n=1 Tax=Skeletonema marinoi TaxID=267567 RepID=A0A6T7KGU3_9STRA|mmetsp:Transcript_1544/g.2322  ORF Transcript_1544/g.2322 Transcript_1544/m.2322 type:complete len:360 (-) Transcript_1544:95-1174(-)|eukprot:scaffold8671_cov138-Skeletonema_marinoi.AAC.2
MFKSIALQAIRKSVRATSLSSPGLQQQVATRAFATAGFPPPRLFDYETVTSNLTVADAIESVEAAFKALAKGKVDVPMPMHIGIEESSVAGPGDCHIKGGYVSATPTFTVKLACVSFYKNVEKGLPPGSGIFIVVNAVTGAPLGVFQENRFMTDLRTGAAGAVAMKYCSSPEQDVVGFIGCGAIAKNMARAAATVRPIKGVAYAIDGAEEFAAEMSAELGVPFEVVSSAEELCGKSDIIYTQTPGASTVLEKDWLNPKGVTIIASGSDQPTKCEIPPDVLAASKYISDLTKQTSKVGELRSALKAGVMTEADVYAELGEVVNGDKAGREGNEIIVVDLTGTGAQDAAIGQVAWDKLSQL